MMNPLFFQQVNPLSDFMTGWLSSEASYWDSINLRLVYIDINEGFLSDGVLFAQIMYWHGRNRETGEPRLRIERDGYLWLAKGLDEWWDECRLTERNVRDCLARIAKRGLIAKDYFKFAGKKTLHIRVSWDKLEVALKEKLKIPPEKNSTPRSGKTKKADETLTLPLCDVKRQTENETAETDFLCDVKRQTRVTFNVTPYTENTNRDHLEFPPTPQGGTQEGEDSPSAKDTDPQTGNPENEIPSLDANSFHSGSESQTQTFGDDPKNTEFGAAAIFSPEEKQPKTRAEWYEKFRQHYNAAKLDWWIQCKAIREGQGRARALDKLAKTYGGWAEAFCRFELAMQGFLHDSWWKDPNGKTTGIGLDQLLTNDKITKKAEEWEQKREVIAQRQAEREAANRPVEPSPVIEPTVTAFEPPAPPPAPPKHLRTPNGFLAKRSLRSEDPAPTPTERQESNTDQVVAFLQGLYDDPEKRPQALKILQSSSDRYALRRDSETSKMIIIPIGR